MTYDKKVGPAILPLQAGDKAMKCELWYYSFGDSRWVAVCYGDLKTKRVMLRIESACIFGHIFHSRQCDCGFQLNEAMVKISQAEAGLVLYAIDQDARGAGIEAHFQIYYLRQHENLDTEGVYSRLGVPIDSRDYQPVVAILRDLGVGQITLLSNNKERMKLLTENGFDAQFENLEAPLDEHNMATLMLEKEDLDYTWSFKTHSDWLMSLQDKVTHDNTLQGACLVSKTHELVAEYFSSNWDIAHGLAVLVPASKQQTSELVVYLTDFPRMDELSLYSGIGAKFVVIPFAVIPSWLQESGKRVGIKVQDWERRNKYAIERPQWNLILETTKVHVYECLQRMRIRVLDSDYDAALTALENSLANVEATVVNSGRAAFISIENELISEQRKKVLAALCN